ncbi:MAG: hypothetical protein ACRDD7_08705 [Peptostreptococcaceae bacterium]
MSKVYVLTDLNKREDHKVVDWILDDGADSYQRTLTTQHLINEGRNEDYPNCVIQELEVDGEFNEGLNTVSIFSVNGIPERFVVNQLALIVILYNEYIEREKESEYPRKFGFKMENYDKNRGVIVD